MLAIVAIPGGPAQALLNSKIGNTGTDSSVAESARLGAGAISRAQRPEVSNPNAAAAGDPSAAANGGAVTVDELIVGSITADSITVTGEGTQSTTMPSPAPTDGASSSSSTAPRTTPAPTGTTASSSTATSSTATSSTATSSTATSPSASTTARTTTSTTTTSTATLAGQGAALSGIIADPRRLTALPTSGTPWTNLLKAANDASGGVDLVNQDNTHAARTVAAALVYARTGDVAQRDKVITTLRRLPSASLSGARVLSVGRQLGGYAIAANLVDYRDAAFRSWIGGMRTKDIGNHGRWVTINATSEDSANNWGTWAMSSRIAISSYLGDTADLHRAATVFRGWTGERSFYAGFRKSSEFDASWACGEAWVPINPASCGAKAGAIVEDISRSAGSYPTIDSTGLMYSWEVMGGAALSSRLLERAGYADVWQWGDRALLRAAAFLDQHGGYAPSYRVNQYIPHEINTAYGVSLGPVGTAGYGRQFGFTDWLR